MEGGKTNEDPLFDPDEVLRLGAEVGAINLCDQTNIFYVDVAEFQVISRSGFLPYLSYLSFSLELN